MGTIKWVKGNTNVSLHIVNLILMVISVKVKYVST